MNQKTTHGMLPRPQSPEQIRREYRDKLDELRYLTAPFIQMKQEIMARQVNRLIIARTDVDMPSLYDLMFTGDLRFRLDDPPQVLSSTQDIERIEQIDDIIRHIKDLIFGAKPCPIGPTTSPAANTSG
jgi:hypothetical protein